MFKSFLTWLTGQMSVDTWIFLLLLFGFTVGLTYMSRKAIDYVDTRLKERYDGK